MWLKIKPEVPLILGDVRAGSQFLSSIHYIPGRVLRGAWAEWLQAQDQQNILPTVERVRIGNFFPTTEWRPIRYTFPLPLSALTCKRKSGFLREPHKENPGHGVVDTLLPQLAYSLLEEAGARFSVPFALTCIECGDRMEPAGGFYTLYRDGSTERYAQIQLRYHAQTKVGLSRHRRAAVEQMLYTASALSPRVKSLQEEDETTALIFMGRVHGEREDVEALIDAVNHVAIGALHTRGYGRVRAEEADVEGFPGIKERVTRFKETLAHCWQDLKRLAVNAEDLPEGPEGIYFSVDLLSPGVFRQGGVPGLVPTLHINGQALEPVFWMTRPDLASGWSAGWGLPKPTNLAARMGSTYVYRWEGDPKPLITALEHLERRGIGERCDEGFGECLICHPFHQEVEEK
ncbi:MAG: CRISPR-associated RAMP protein Csx10 [Deltaproteobacteria bacterium]|nr:CRISPR-associated RAMP protein Csx10 [Deltaproteobacteria bacterium]